MGVEETIRLIPGVRGCNCYFIIEDDRLTLVDTGMSGNAEKIIDFISELGRDPDDLKTVAITHSHMDHVGSLAALKERTGAEIAIHELEAPYLSGEEEVEPPKGLMGFLFRLFGGLFSFRKLEPDILLKDGDYVGSLKVIHVPGHTRGSISLFLPNKALLTGDSIITNREGNISLPPRQFTSDMRRAKESMRMMAGLDFEALLPGHGRPVWSEGSRRLREYVSRPGFL